MTSYLMIAFGLVACSLGLALTFATTTRGRLDVERPWQTSVSLRTLFVIYGIDLLLQTYQLDGSPQPLLVALADAVTTGAIFCLLAHYAGGLTGADRLPGVVVTLALGQFGLAIARAFVRAVPPSPGRAAICLSLWLTWLAVSAGLALSVALSTRRRLRAALPARASRRIGSEAAWPRTVERLTWATLAIVAARAVLAPWLGAMPALRAALDTPLVDTVYIVVFVALGAASNGFATVSHRLAARPAIDPEAEARRERLLDRGDMILDRDFADPNLSMPRLAAAIGCSEHRFSTALNQGRGINFFAYVNAKRISEAQKLIRAGEATMTDIAFACGYNSRSTFYVAFKTVSGLTPAEWRSTARQSERAHPDTSLDRRS